MKESHFQFAARAGYVARGVVFALVSGLALFSGISADKAEAKSALSVLLEQPAGRIWVAFIGMGLLGFVAWRLLQSLADVDNHGKRIKGLAIRAALFGSAFTYLGMAIYALTHAVGMGGANAESGEKDFASWLMSQPFGSYIVVALGIGFIIGGIATAAKGITGKFERYLKDLPKQTLTRLVCIYGLVARGIIFGLIGILFIYAGLHVDPSEAGNMADALRWLRQLPFGSALYVGAAGGLAAFGVYNFIEAGYRIVQAPAVTGTRKALQRKVL